MHWRVHNQSVVEVEWASPVTPNGVITKYLVEFRLNKSEAQNNATANGAPIPEREWSSKSTTNASIFLNDLQRNEVYAVRVRAETKAGSGEPSDIVLVRIFNKKPPQDDKQQPIGDEPKPEVNTLITQDQQKLGSNLYCHLKLDAPMFFTNHIVAGGKCF